MCVTVENNKMTSKIFDLINEDEYILVDIQDSMGEFVGKIVNLQEKEMIRNFEKNDIDAVMQIWKSENIDKNTGKNEYTMTWNK